MLLTETGKNELQKERNTDIDEFSSLPWANSPVISLFILFLSTIFEKAQPANPLTSICHKNQASICHSMLPRLSVRTLILPDLVAGHNADLFLIMLASVIRGEGCCTRLVLLFIPTLDSLSSLLELEESNICVMILDCKNDRFEKSSLVRQSFIFNRAVLVVRTRKSDVTGVSI
ncbi:MAG: hypothetical protein GX846_03885 [Deltaproteobacteria bacterium]|nr:hypothetical protein [Deltaproteobacteria bacterium]